jgi:hypothetical protein
MENGNRVHQCVGETLLRIGKPEERVTSDIARGICQLNKQGRTERAAENAEKAYALRNHASEIEAPNSVFQRGQTGLFVPCNTPR